MRSSGFWRRRSSERTYGARPLRRALQRFVEDPLSEALIAGGIAQRPAFLEVYMENNQLFYRPIRGGWRREGGWAGADGSLDESKCMLKIRPGDEPGRFV